MMSREHPQIAVIVPALNESGSIGAVVRGMIEHGASRVIVVDNGSTDDTSAVARTAGAEVVSEPRRGYGRACMAGIDVLGNADIVVFADGDGADDPRDLPGLLAPVLSGDAALCIGSRTRGDSEKGALPPHSVFGNRLGAFLIRILFGQKVTDMGPFRAITRPALDSLRMSDPNFGWNVEMQAKAALLGLDVAEIPVRYRRRRTGQSKITGDPRKSLQAGAVIIGTIVRIRLREQ